MHYSLCALPKQDTTVIHLSCAICSMNTQSKYDLPYLTSCLKSKFEESKWDCVLSSRFRELDLWQPVRCWWQNVELPSVWRFWNIRKWCLTIIRSFCSGLRNWSNNANRSWNRAGSGLGRNRKPSGRLTWFVLSRDIKHTHALTYSWCKSSSEKFAENISVECNVLLLAHIEVTSKRVLLN